MKASRHRPSITPCLVSAIVGARCHSPTQPARSGLAVEPDPAGGLQHDVDDGHPWPFPRCGSAPRPGTAARGRWNLPPAMSKPGRASCGCTRWCTRGGAELAGQEIDFTNNVDGIDQLKIEVDPRSSSTRPTRTTTSRACCSASGSRARPAAARCLPKVRYSRLGEDRRAAGHADCAGESVEGAATLAGDGGVVNRIRM